MQETNIVEGTPSRPAQPANLRGSSLRRMLAASVTGLSIVLTGPTPLLAQPAAATDPSAASSMEASDSASTDTDAAEADSAETEPAQPVDPVAVCLSEHTDGQALRNQGKLLESRDAFRKCSQNVCPAVVRRDCLAWSDELRSQIPTVTFRVTLDGKTTTDAKVYLDGDFLEKAMDGRAVELNPGIYQLRFEHGDFPALEQELIASEGERYRVVTGAFQTPQDDQVAVAPPPVAPTLLPPKAEEIERPVPTVTYVFLGLGAVGAISAGAWGLSTMVTKNDLEATCSPNCSDDKIGAVEQRALLTDISAGVGLLSLIIAGTTYLLRPEVSSTPAVEFDAASLNGDGLMGVVRVNAF